jgi:hypothetical protein
MHTPHSSTFDDAHACAAGALGHQVTFAGLVPGPPPDPPGPPFDDEHEKTKAAEAKRTIGAAARAEETNIGDLEGLESKRESSSERAST